MDLLGGFSGWVWTWSPSVWATVIWGQLLWALQVPEPCCIQGWNGKHGCVLFSATVCCKGTAVALLCSSFSLRSQIQHNRTFLLFIWPCHVACGILVPGPEIEPMPPAGEGQSLNHWTTRGVPCSCTFLTNISHLPHNSDNSVRDFLWYSIHLFIHPPNLLLNLLSVNHWARCLGYNSDK